VFIEVTFVPLEKFVGSQSDIMQMLKETSGVH
jgi:hypothetical protein